MKLKKQIETHINLSAKESYNPNIKNYILQKLSLNKNKCINGVYIVDIISVDYYSDVVISSYSLEGIVDIDVIYTAEVIVLQKGDILADCQFIEVTANKNKLKAKNSYAVVSVDAVTELQNMQPGDIIPIKIQKVDYNYLSSIISVSGKFLKYPIKTRLYILQNVRDENNSIAELLQQYEELQKIKPDGYDFIANKLNPFKKPISGTLSINDILANKDKVIRFYDDARIDRTKLEFISEGENVKIETGNFTPMIVNIINKRINYISMIHKLCEMFGSNYEKQPIWNIYDKIKQDS